MINPMNFGFLRRLRKIRSDDIFFLADALKNRRSDMYLLNFKDVVFEGNTAGGKSTTNDPQIYLYLDLQKPLDSSACRYVSFSLYADKNTQGQFIWWLDDGRWQTACSFKVQEGWHEYCFDMKSLPTEGTVLGSGIGWEGKVTRLRLDPGEIEGVTLKIRDARGSFQPQGKMTSTLFALPAEGPADEINLNANYEDCKRLPLVVKSKPVLIYAEISTKCNLRCRMCGRYNYHIPASQQGFMSRAAFLNLTKLFTPGSQLALFGRGESLLHPDFIYFLGLARKARMKVGFNTNGLMLTAKMAQAMVELKQTHLTFSCSAGTPETYHKVHGVNSWDKLWANIQMLNEAKMKYGLPSGEGDIRNVHPAVYLEFVSQLDNIRELPALLRKAFEYKTVGLLVIDMTAHSDAMEKQRMNIPENQPLAAAVYKEALALHEELVKQAGRGFDFRLPNSYSPITKKFITESEKQIFSDMKKTDVNNCDISGENFCIEPWRTFYVRFDGTVAPCVITGRVLGDLKKDSGEKIWNGEVYRKFRERMKSEKKPYECLHCHLFPGPKRYDTKLGDKATYEPL